jgi:hypothetical protein
VRRSRWPLYCVVLAPELAPGNVDELDGGVIVEEPAGGCAAGAVPPGAVVVPDRSLVVFGEVAVLVFGEPLGTAVLGTDPAPGALVEPGAGIVVPGAAPELPPVPGVVVPGVVIVPDFPPTPGVVVLGVELGVAVLGIVPGVAVLGVVPGVAVPGVVPGAPVPGVLVVVSGTSPCASGPNVSVWLVNFPVGGGGPASGRAGAGGTFLLLGSVTGVWPGRSGGGSFDGGLGGAKLGVPSFWSGAFVPNGLR